MVQHNVREVLSSSVVGVGSGGDGIASVNPRSLWGLYCVYLCIGVVYGFFAANIKGPLICQYLFGPYQLPGGTDQNSCNAGYALYGFGWTIKLFIALFVENFPIFKTRKRYWIVFGWAFALIMLAVAGFLIPTFEDKIGGNKGYTSWVMVMAVSNFGIAIADVAADGLAVSYSKLEADDKKGTIISTNYQCRFFTTMVFGGFFKMLFMGGPHWVNKLDPRPPTFDFDLTLQQVHFALLACAFLPFIGICLWVEDPPQHEDGHTTTGCKGVAEAIGVIWKCTKSYAVWSMVIYAVGINGISAIVNPADGVVSNIANSNSIQTGVGTAGSYALLVVGLQIFKKYFSGSNLRNISIGCYIMNSALQLPELALVYFGCSWSPQLAGWFYQFQNDLPSLMQAIAFCLLQLVIVDIAPPGLEASLYEFLLTATNAAQSVAILLQGLLADWFDLKSGINGANYTHYHEHDLEKYDYYQNRMALGILVTVAVGVATAVIFSLFLPRSAKDCREWAAVSAWQTDKVACLNFVVLISMIVVTLYGLVGNLATHLAFFNQQMVQTVFGFVLLSYCLLAFIYRVVSGVPAADKVDPLAESSA